MWMVGAGSDGWNVRSSVTLVSRYPLDLRLSGADSDVLDVRLSVT
jgi:hypothetical protein